MTQPSDPEQVLNKQEHSHIYLRKSKEYSRIVTWLSLETKITLADLKTPIPERPFVLTSRRKQERLPLEPKYSPSHKALDRGERPINGKFST